MIVATLYGGLGNQMFIYAMSRALALRSGEDLILNCSSGFKYDYRFHRQYALNDFSIKYQTDKLLSFDFVGGRLIRKISEKMGRHLFFPEYKLLNEVSGNRYFENKWIEEKQHKIIINGYWHSEKYFKDFENQIRKDFIFSNFFSKDITQQADTIRNTKGIPIALGIRLYQECEKVTIPITEKEYYSRAMQIIIEKVPDAVFYIFTQVPEWAKENLDRKYKIEIMPENAAIDDLYLMTLCKHHIISNSSFYWWGAWLADKSGIKIAPSKAMNQDFIPETWIKL
ncbi:MAG: alpha-1,2-fucosyltransferase [Candidatus Symbiothrix sp.]|jgi:hypothetical protein|nr:alpha-1,2-fucosyltransferase [Candidatus Symbiothrix sp.]